LIAARALFLGFTAAAIFFAPVTAFEGSGASSDGLPRTDLREEGGAAEEAGFDLVEAGLALLVGASASGELAARFLPLT